MPGGLIICGILTTVAVVACICLDDTLGFNMLMCVFCVMAIVSLWTEDKKKKMDSKETEPKESEEKTDKEI